MGDFAGFLRLVPAASAAIMLNRVGTGLQATLFEFPDRIPAPRRETAHALRELASMLLEQADKLDNDAP